MAASSMLLDFLQQRNSAPRLDSPAPDAVALQQMIRAATRVPDHAWLRPWRFISVEGDRRKDLGKVFEAALLKREPEAAENVRERARNAPLRAPLILVVVTRISEHPKVPSVEQRKSAACAAYAILLAAEAQGFAGVWRTGDNAYDPDVMAALGLNEDEEIAAFIYLGTRDGRSKAIPELSPEDFHSRW
ncbi:nitroreductase family protein [Sediminihaliea albiluteola]|nr:nitroreductase [Sediminihaliea albiluteola]